MSKVYIPTCRLHFHHNSVANLLLHMIRGFAIDITLGGADCESGHLPGFHGLHRNRVVRIFNLLAWVRVTMPC